MGNVYNMSDYEAKAERHQNNQLNDYLDSLMMTDEEERIQEELIEDALTIMVEDRITDINDDETIDALLNNADEFHDVFSLVLEPYDEAKPKDIERAYKLLKTLIDGTEDSMRKSLRCVVE